MMRPNHRGKRVIARVAFIVALAAGVVGVGLAVGHFTLADVYWGVAFP